MTIDDGSPFDTVFLIHHGALVLTSTAGQSTGRANPISLVGYELMIGATYQLELTRAGTSYTCQADRSGVVQTTGGMSGLSNAPFTAGLRVVSASAQYQWVMVVSSP